MDMGIKDYRKHSPGVKRKTNSTRKLPLNFAEVTEGTTHQMAPPEVGRIKALETERRSASLEHLREELEDSDAVTSSSERLDIKVALSHKVSCISGLCSSVDVVKQEEMLWSTFIRFIATMKSL